MARRYKRREFITDASVAFAGIVLLKVLGAIAGNSATTAAALDEPFTVSGYRTDIQADKG